MKKAVSIASVLAISLLLGVGPVAAQTGTKAAPSDKATTGDKAAQTDSKATESKAATTETHAAKGEAKGHHSMTGEVTKVDSKKGWVDVKTPEGSMKLHFPPEALQNVHKGDNVTVELGLTRVAAAAKPSGTETAPKARQ
jgi:hypothetical protein